MKPGPERNAAICAFYKIWVQIDGSAAVLAIANSRDRTVHEIGTSAMVGAAPTSAMEDLARGLVSITPDRGLFFSARRGMENVIWQWSSVDPIAVAKFLDENRDKDLRGYFGSLVRSWAELDPDAALTWLQRQKTDDQTEDAISDLVFGWLENDRAAAVDFVIANGNDKKFAETIRHVAFSTFLRDPESARDFLERVPSPDARQEAMKNIVHISGTHTVLGALPEWERKTEDVMKWVLAFPPDMWMELGDLAWVWDRDDSEGFDAWFDGLPVSTQDQILADYSTNAGLSVDDYTIALAMDITDPVLREKTLRQLVSSLGDNRNEISDRMNQLELSPVHRALLTKLMPHE